MTLLRMCSSTMESLAVPGHTHTCMGNHEDGDDHFCKVCGRFWWQRESGEPVPVSPEDAELLNRTLTFKRGGATGASGHPDPSA